MKSIRKLVALALALGASNLALAATATDGSAPPQGQMPGKMQQRMQQHMQEMDSNGDGNISKQEFLANCEKRFARMDSNGDGQISPQEREQMKAKMMQHKAPMGSQPPAQ
jgi:hypothetical protein